MEPQATAHACHMREDTCLSYEEEDTGLSLIVDGTTDNGPCMSYEEEDTCMSYEEEDTCLSLIVDGTTSNGTNA